MWSSHITNICNKTRRLVGVLYRRFYKHYERRYSPELVYFISFIRPHLEYAAAPSDSFLKKDISALEDVQKFALKVCTKSWDISYDGLLNRSQLPTLEARRHQAKLCNLYNIENGLVHFPDAPVTNRVPEVPVSVQSLLFRAILTNTIILFSPVQSMPGTPYHPRCKLLLVPPHSNVH